MDEFYKLFLEYMREEYSRNKISGLIDYMEWLQRNYISIGDSGSFRESFPIIFDTKSKDTVLEDIIFKLRNSSISGLINSKSKTYLFDTHCPDLQSEYEYHETFRKR